MTEEATPNPVMITYEIMYRKQEEPGLVVASVSRSLRARGEIRKTLAFLASLAFLLAKMAAGEPELQTVIESPEFRLHKLTGHGNSMPCPRG